MKQKRLLVMADGVNYSHLLDAGCHLLWQKTTDNVDLVGYYRYATELWYYLTARHRL